MSRPVDSAPSPPVILAPATRRPRRRLATFTALNALGLALLWCLENAVGERTNPTALLLYIPQQPLAALTALLLLVCAWRRQKRLFALNLSVLCAWMLSFGGAQVPWPLWASWSSRPTVRVVMWNVRSWEMGSVSGIAQLHTLTPDIICIAESAAPGFSKDAPWGPEVANAWTTQFPGWHAAQAGDITTLSRFPLLSQQNIESGDQYGRRLLRTRWQTPRGPLTLVTAHISTTMQLWHHTHTEYTDPRRWLEVARHARDSAQARERQWGAIESSVTGETGPFIVTGDFNNPPRGRLYGRLKRKWGDAFAQAGWGCGYTFPAHRPLMRIDYVWLGPGVNATRCFSPPTQSSDHRPVVADVWF